MESLLDGLAKVGKKPPFSVKKGFQTHPGSIKEMLRIINLPRPDLSKLEWRNVHEFTVKDPQGLAYAYADTWFLTSQWRIYLCEIAGQDLYWPTVRHMKYNSLGDVVTAAGLNKNDYDHIGDVVYFQDMLFVPVRHKSQKPPHVLFSLSNSLEVVAFAEVVESFDAWCAINPWNQALYMQDAKDASRLNAYDISSILDVLPERGKWGHQQVLKHLHSYALLKPDGSPDSFDGSQGCCFSANGRMYLTRAKKHALTLWPDTWDNYIYVYDTFTGVRLGVRKTDFVGDFNEIEGISIHPSGVIYIAVADNDKTDTDEFKVFAFRFSSHTPV